MFEIGSLEVYDRGGGCCPESTLYCVLTCTHTLVLIMNFDSGLKDGGCLNKLYSWAIGL